MSKVQNWGFSTINGGFCVVLVGECVYIWRKSQLLVSNPNLRVFLYFWTVFLFFSLFLSTSENPVVDMSAKFFVDIFVDKPHSPQPQAQARPIDHFGFARLTLFNHHGATRPWAFIHDQDPVSWSCLSLKICLSKKKKSWLIWAQSYGIRYR